MTVFDAVLMVIIPVAAIAYVCGVFKVGFIVMDKTNGTGFDFGFYMLTVITGLAIPVAVASYAVNA